MKPTKNPAAVALGRLGGKSTSEAKRNAARRNNAKRWEEYRKRNSMKTNEEKLAEKITRLQQSESKADRIQAARLAQVMAAWKRGQVGDSMLQSAVER